MILLTHWGRVTHICVSDLTSIGSDNGLSPGRRQAIIWTNDGILLIGPLGTNFSEILIVIQTFSFKKMHLKMSSAKWRPFCLGLNELKWHLCFMCGTTTTHVGMMCHAQFPGQMIKGQGHSGHLNFLQCLLCGLMDCVFAIYEANRLNKCIVTECTWQELWMPHVTLTFDFFTWKWCATYRPFTYQANFS